MTVIYVRATIAIAAANKATADAANAGLALASQAEARARKACLMVGSFKCPPSDTVELNGTIRNEGLGKAYDIFATAGTLSTPESPFYWFGVTQIDSLEPNEQRSLSFKTTKRYNDLSWENLEGSEIERFVNAVVEVEIAFRDGVGEFEEQFSFTILRDLHFEKFLIMENKSDRVISDICRS